MRRFAMLALFPLIACGCTQTTTTNPATPTTQVVAIEDDHDHDHDRGKKLVAHLGKHHVWLTAHLSSKSGHELDVFVEASNEAKAVALPLDKLRGKATKAGDPKEYELTFEPAPAGERPAGEAAGTCSHFVAKTPWLTPADVWTVIVEVELEGRNRKATWKNFTPKVFAHHEE